MTLTECLGVALLSAVLVLSAAGLGTAIVLLRRSPQHPGSRFLGGWLGAISLLAGLASCVALSLTLGRFVPSSGLALAVVILTNLLAQPVLLLMLCGGSRKLLLGLTGR